MIRPKTLFSKFENNQYTSVNSILELKHNQWNSVEKNYFHQIIFKLPLSRLDKLFNIMLFALRLVGFFSTTCNPHGLVLGLTSDSTFTKHELLFVLSSLFKILPHFAFTFSSS